MKITILLSLNKGWKCRYTYINKYYHVNYIAIKKAIGENVKQHKITNTQTIIYDFL